MMEGEVELEEELTGIIQLSQSFRNVTPALNKLLQSPRTHTL